MLDLYFTDYDAASRAVTTAEAGEFLRAALQLATGGVQIVFVPQRGVLSIYAGAAASRDHPHPHARFPIAGIRATYGA